MRKVDSHNTGKVWEKTNIPKFLKYFGWRNMWKHKHFKAKCFWNVSLDAEIHAVPKIWEKWISIIHEKHEKVQTFQICGFLNYFEWSRNPYNSQNMEKVNAHSREKYGKTQTFQSNGFLKYFGWSRNPYNSQNMGNVNLHSTRKVRENTEIYHNLRYLADLDLMRTHGIPNICECTNSHKMKIFCRKPYHSQAVGFRGN